MIPGMGPRVEQLRTLARQTVKAAAHVVGWPVTHYSAWEREGRLDLELDAAQHRRLFPWLCHHLAARGEPLRIRAVTLWQPHAGFVACGAKTIETRTHPRLASLVGHYVAIHAAQRRPQDLAHWDSEQPHAMAAVRRHYRGQEWMPLGAVVAVAFAWGHRELTERDAAAACCATGPGRWGLSLSHTMPVSPPQTASGRQGIWIWEVPRVEVLG